MKKVTILFVMAIFLNIRIVSAQDTLWTKFYENGAANEIISTEDSGFVWVGLYASKYCITKINKYGDVLWKKTSERNGLKGRLAIYKFNNHLLILIFVDSSSLSVYSIWDCRYLSIR